jgi:hypothetical protein
VDVRRYADATHEMWSSPPNSPTIVGSAVATIVWSSAASDIPAIRPANTVWIWRWVRAYRGAPASAI